MTSHTYIDLLTAIECLQRVEYLLGIDDPQNALVYVRALRDALTEDVLMGEKLREQAQHGPYTSCM